MARKKIASLLAALALGLGAAVAHAGYAEDRALIEDLQARYLFAFDFGDPEGYAGTFAPDGILDFGWGEIRGREAIAKFIADGRVRTEAARAGTRAGERPSIGRHSISNIVVKVEGSKARGVAYWSHMTSGPDGRGGVDFFGHYEDELVKVKGEWLFARRRIYNEAVPEWASQYVNPVTVPSPPPKYRAPSQPAAAAPPAPPSEYRQVLADRPVTASTLVDRIQIEDFLTRYYTDLAAGKAHELAEYFTPDALLDVDGTVARGHAEIAKLYQRPEGAAPPPPAAQRRLGNMLLTNPIINVEGDRATAHVVWTGVMNEGIGKPPGLYEQGREYSELRKVDGRWLISRRFISSDSGTPDRFDATWQPREHR